MRCAKRFRAIAAGGPMGPQATACELL
jgi:hypothetical protein